MRQGLSRIGALAATLALAGCGTVAGGEGGGSVVRNLLLYGGTTVPPAAPIMVEDFDCPPVDVPEGGAALQTYGGGRTGDPSALRTQIALGQLARECTLQPDGSVLVKVGVEARALIGPGGGSGRVDAPVQIVVRRRDAIYARRAARLAVVIPPGETQGSATVVEQGMVVPPGIGRDFQIDVSLGGSAPAARTARRR